MEESVDKGAGMSGGAVVDEGDCDPEVQVAKIFSKVLEVEIDPGKVKSMIAMLKILEASGLPALKDLVMKIEEEKLDKYRHGVVTASNSYQKYGNAMSLPLARPGVWNSNNKWPPIDSFKVEITGGGGSSPGKEYDPNFCSYKSLFDVFRKKSKKN